MLQVTALSQGDAKHCVSGQVVAKVTDTWPELNVLGRENSTRRFVAVGRTVVSYPWGTSISNHGTPAMLRALTINAKDDHNVF